MGDAEYHQQVKRELALIDALMPTVRELARRDVARTQTDFLGRMAETIMEMEVCCEPHQVLNEDQREDFHDAAMTLAALALAQAAMSCAPLQAVTASDIQERDS